MTIDRQCGSSQQAVNFAAAGVIAGHHDIVVAGGVESMSRVPMFSNMVGGEGPFPASMHARYDNGLVNQGVSAELIAQRWGLSRGYLDEFALASQERAAQAQAEGLFDEEIVPVETPTGLVTADQGVRPGTTMESLAGLKTPFLEGGVVTAGNASQISDGSAALVIMSSARAARARACVRWPGSIPWPWPVSTPSSC